MTAMDNILHGYILLTTFICQAFGNNGPVFISTPGILIFPENTTVGTVLGTLAARDDDGPQELRFSIPTGHPTAQLVELANVRGVSSSPEGRQVDIVLKDPLDRDYTSSSNVKLRFNVEDDPGGDGNLIIQEITLYVTDVNDETPQFVQSRYEEEVLENATLNTLVLTVSAKDPDQGEGGRVKYSMTPVGQAISDDYQNAFSVDPTSGEVRVHRKLDASVYNYYEYRLMGTDGGGKQGTSVLLIKVIDIQDKPPYFTNLPYSVSVKENVNVTSSVIQVTALDGDKGGTPNNVSYSFVGGEFSNFAINNATGWITVKTPLDRDAADVRQRGGVYAIYVKAKEIDNTQPDNLITATTLVTITVEDVNDNAPVFNSPTYEATILENMQSGVPITFTGPGQITFMNASDIDQGTNSHFELSLMKDGQPYHDFAPLPTEVFVESSVLIRVQNSTALDYERLTEVTFEIVATEKNTPEKKSSSAVVTVRIQDMNDNTPVFQPETLPVLNISENATLGHVLIDLNATDADKGVFGNVTYHLRGTNLVFDINENTGVVTLTDKLDREKVDHYFVTAEARDGGGLTTFVNLDIRVLDINDMVPQFRRSEQYVTVREDSTQFLRGDLKLEAFDDDEPNTRNSDIKFRIIKASAGLENKFSVNDTSGIVSMVDKIDYEALPPGLGGRVLLEVEVFDNGVPSLMSSVNITVEVEDVNDNAPIFDKPLYTASIPESSVAGSLVVKVSATDGDRTSPNNQLLYRIDSGAGDKFRINFTSGEIVVEIGAKLDRETKDSYSLNVSATDRGATPLTGHCIVDITITDVNDEPPVFNPAVVNFNINENASAGDQVNCLTATDSDTNHSLVYSLVPGSVQGFDENSRVVNVSAGVQGYFSVERSTGCIKVSGKLDREMAETVTLKATVEDVFAESVPNERPQTATATVTITLLDYNDNPPEFLPNASYNVQILEGLENSEVLRFETRDRDKGQTVTYHMLQDPNNNFEVTESSGILRVKKQLDREATQTLEVKVIAKDSGNPQQTSTATVSVTVQDINDNNPEFSSYQLTYTVAEDAAVNTSVANITATDKDFQGFGTVVYSCDISNDDNKLRINRLTGEILVAKTLDREERSSYTLYVTAIDNPSDPTNQRTNRTKAITINVQDVNDNDPQFTNIEKDGSTRVSVLENAWDPNKEGQLVYSITAEDADTGVNAKLVYQISANQTFQNLFKINTKEQISNGIPKYTGEIRVAGSLIGNVGDILVNVTVTDKGVPPRSAQGSMIIVVEDVNLHQPVFTSPPGPRATISTLEKQPVGSRVFMVSATDEDHGRNAEVVYEIQQENDWEKFHIDPTSGELTNKEILDRETRPTYEIKIKAEDKGVPNPLFSTLTLIIHMLDIDDNPPEFEVDRTLPYPIKIEEERVHDQTTTMLNIATDKDDGNNSIICYYIIGGDPEVRSHFQLDQGGNLTLTRSFDRENLTKPFINMIVFATPKCFADFPTDLRPAVYPPTDYLTNKTLLWVEVEITDINDNPPKFKQSVLTLGVTRDTGFGTSITSLKDLVTDEDATMQVDFSALCTEQHLQDRKVDCTPNQVEKNQPFLVFKNGTVATNTYFQTNMYGYYLIHIQAKENVTGGPPFIANATLRISLINDDQRVKVVFRNTPDVVRGFQVAFTQKLQEKTGYRIVVDKIQTHENSAGQPEVNKTDMFIHGEDMKTNETISAAELLRVIDANAEALLGLRYDYKVIEITLSTSQTEEKSLEDVFKMALILVAIILTLLCTAISIVFYISRQQYKRKLKAATAMAYATTHNGSGTMVSQCSQSDLHKLELPGTNLHAYENTNPIYLEKVLLEEAGERDVDDDSLDNNEVDPAHAPQFTEQQVSMNFYTEDNNLNKIPQSKLGDGDAILSAAIRQHQQNKLQNGDAVYSNGDALHENHSDVKEDNFSGLPTTEI